MLIYTRWKTKCSVFPNYSTDFSAKFYSTRSPIWGYEIPQVLLKLSKWGINDWNGLEMVSEENNGIMEQWKEQWNKINRKVYMWSEKLLSLAGFVLFFIPGSSNDEYRMSML